MLSLVIKQEFDSFIETTFTKEDHKQFFKNHVAKEKIINKIISEIQGAHLRGYLLSDHEIKDMTKQMANMYCRGLLEQLEIKEGKKKRFTLLGGNDAT